MAFFRIGHVGGGYVTVIISRLSDDGTAFVKNYTTDIFEISGAYKDPAYIDMNYEQYAKHVVLEANTYIARFGNFNAYQWAVWERESNSTTFGTFFYDLVNCLGLYYHKNVFPKLEDKVGIRKIDHKLLTRVRCLVEESNDSQEYLEICDFSTHICQKGETFGYDFNDKRMWIPKQYYTSKVNAAIIAALARSIRQKYDVETVKRMACEIYAYSTISENLQEPIARGLSRYLINTLGGPNPYTWEQ